MRARVIREHIADLVKEHGGPPPESNVVALRKR
jgi:hypothetical protein